MDDTDNADQTLFFPNYGSIYYYKYTIKIMFFNITTKYKILMLTLQGSLTQLKDYS